MTNTYTPIASVTLSSASATVDFTSIPQTFRDLILIVDGKAATAQTFFRMRVNSDSGNNYNVVNMMGASNGSNSYSSSNQNGFDLDFFVSTITTDNNFFQIQFLDYSQTNKHKTMLLRSKTYRDTELATNSIAGRWASTSAITSMSIFLNAGNLASGSTFSLYGIAG